MRVRVIRGHMGISQVGEHDYSGFVGGAVRAGLDVMRTRNNREAFYAGSA